MKELLKNKSYNLDILTKYTNFINFIMIKKYKTN